MGIFFFAVKKCNAGFNIKKKRADSDIALKVINNNF